MFNDVNLTDLVVVGFVGCALCVSIWSGEKDLAMALGTGLLGFVGGSKVVR